jgi:hypothetical protein
VVSCCWLVEINPPPLVTTVWEWSDERPKNVVGVVAWQHCSAVEIVVLSNGILDHERRGA